MRATTVMMGALLLSACGAATADRAQDEKAAIAAVTAANAAKDQAMIARDPAALARFYTEDYQVIDARAEVHGKKNQVDFMTRSVELIAAQSDEVKVDMLAADAALVTGRMTGRYRMDGKESSFVERYTGLWVKQGRDWRVKHEHGSMQPDEGIADSNAP
jgi:ketosteroid isomerase-like protein